MCHSEVMVVARSRRSSSSVRPNNGFRLHLRSNALSMKMQSRPDFFYPGSKSNRKQKIHANELLPPLCSDFFFLHHMYLNMNPGRRLLPLGNLWGIQHHILTAISGTICFLRADITRLWTDLVLKCYNVLYVLILFSCGIQRTQPTGKKKIYFLRRCVNQEGGNSR